MQQVKMPEKGIVAVFQPQAWINDHATDIDGLEDVDVTEQVLRLSLDRIHALQDYRDSTDDLVGGSSAALQHDGPFTVSAVDSVREFFDVKELSDITEDMLLAARQAMLKMQQSKPHNASQALAQQWKVTASGSFCLWKSAALAIAEIIEGSIPEIALRRLRAHHVTTEKMAVSTFYERAIEDVNELLATNQLPKKGDLVLATKTTNPQFKAVIGTVTGDAEKDNVSIRLLHVLRKWGNDGHGRPDGSFVQAIYAGTMNFTEAIAADVEKIDTARLVQLLGENRNLSETQNAVSTRIHNDECGPGAIGFDWATPGGKDSPNIVLEVSGDSVRVYMPLRDTDKTFTRSLWLSRSEMDGVVSREREIQGQHGADPLLLKAYERAIRDANRAAGIVPGILKRYEVSPTSDIAGKLQKNSIQRCL